MGGGISCAHTHTFRMLCISACLIMQMSTWASINMWDSLSHTHTHTHTHTDYLKHQLRFLCTPSLFSICRETLLNLRAACLPRSFWMNLFSIFQFRWSATLTMLKGIWDGRRAWRSRGGWMWAFEMVQTGQLFSFTTTRTHTEACSYPATREGTGVLQPAWVGINEPRCFPPPLTQSDQAEEMRAGE